MKQKQYQEYLESILDIMSIERLHFYSERYREMYGDDEFLADYIEKTLRLENEKYLKGI